MKSMINWKQQLFSSRCLFIGEPHIINKAQHNFEVTHGEDPCPSVPWSLPAFAPLILAMFHPPLQHAVNLPRILPWALLGQFKLANFWRGASLPYTPPEPPSTALSVMSAKPWEMSTLLWSACLHTKSFIWVKHYYWVQPFPGSHQSTPKLKRPNLNAKHSPIPVCFDMVPIRFSIHKATNTSSRWMSTLNRLAGQVKRLLAFTQVKGK